MLGFLTRCIKYLSALAQMLVIECMHKTFSMLTTHFFLLATALSENVVLLTQHGFHSKTVMCGNIKNDVIGDTAAQSRIALFIVL